MKKVLVIEDESYAAAALCDLLAGVNPPIQVLAVVDSVQSAIAWFEQNPAPDLIISDIQLGDGLSFGIFERLSIKTPVIFLTAFDAYAIKAFELNSIHYLLKPTTLPQLQAAVDKFLQWEHQKTEPDWKSLLLQLKPPKTYRTRFSVEQGETLGHVEVQDIAYFEADDRYVLLVTRQGKRYIINHLMRDLEHLLDPARFFRLNRSYIAQLSAIESAAALSKSKIAVRLRPETKEPVVVSAAVSAAFRRWLDEA